MLSVNVAGMNIHQVMGIALGLRELHGIHTLPSVPMEEGRTFVHGHELKDILRYVADVHQKCDTNLTQGPLEEFLHGSGVRETCCSLSIA